ncbi:MAG TPA: hypothetical protein DCQ06_08020 [Myxococcales bacterium]|nr:hypothetical protein [Myxococcales bacterium]HAN31530.1 hypothetical protein [Myxococcales bacterium]
MIRIPLCMLLTLVLSLSACGSDDGGGGNSSTATGTGTCAVDGDCQNGQTCQNGQCTASFSGGDTLQPFDSGTSPDGATDSGATVDTGGGASAGETCGSCKTESECASGYACVPLLNSTDSNFCVKKCSAGSDCDEGLLCQQATQAEQKYCVPPTFKCEGCAVSGCAQDESCDFSSNPPVCTKVGGPCASCQLSKDCGAGQVCVSQAGTKVCAPVCGVNKACPTNSACVNFDAGIEACSYLADACCYGDSCQSSAACQGCAGKCVAGKCVECIKDDDCTDGSCLLKNHTCQKAKCPTEKPQKLLTGECVECTNDTHCAASSAGPKCIGNICSPSNQSNECSVCKDPYPGCVEINGSWSCVECATDADCAAKNAGACSAKTYSCSGTSAGGGPKTGSCKSDSDCSAGTSGFSLACDVGSGLCYDKDGQCDNVTAFCNSAAGSICKPFDLLGLGGAAGGLPSIPGLPGGGGSAPASSGAGVCSCGSSAASAGWDDTLCKLTNASCDCVKDHKSKACEVPLVGGSCCQPTSSGCGMNPLSLLACLGQLQNSSPDPACFGGKPCLDLSCLTAMMGAGGAPSSGAGGGYCGTP